LRCYRCKGIYKSYPLTDGVIVQRIHIVGGTQSGPYEEWQGITIGIVAREEHILCQFLV
jgi:hypothetical protein